MSHVNQTGQRGRTRTQSRSERKNRIMKRKYITAIILTLGIGLPALQAQPGPPWARGADTGQRLGAPQELPPWAAGGARGPRWQRDGNTGPENRDWGRAPQRPNRPAAQNPQGPRPRGRALAQTPRGRGATAFRGPRGPQGRMAPGMNRPQAGRRAQAGPMFQPRRAPRTAVGACPYCGGNKGPGMRAGQQARRGNGNRNFAAPPAPWGRGQAGLAPRGNGMRPQAGQAGRGFGRGQGLRADRMGPPQRGGMGAGRWAPRPQGDTPPAPPEAHQE